jgi:hypothetical protein
VSDTSAKEIGTSRASMNRTGKTRAAQGVKKHYNEYKDFLQREVEAHICAAFLEMFDMKTLNGKYMHNISYVITSNKLIQLQNLMVEMVIYHL